MYWDTEFAQFRCALWKKMLNLKTLPKEFLDCFLGCLNKCSISSRRIQINCIAEWNRCAVIMGSRETDLESFVLRTSTKSTLSSLRCIMFISSCFLTTPHKRLVCRIKLARGCQNAQKWSKFLIHTIWC